MGEQLELHLNRDACILSGSCEALVPELFEIDDAGDLQLLQPVVPDELLEAAQDAVDRCPARALSLR